MQKSDARITGNMLKFFAIISMLLDHIGYIFFPQYRFLRYIGRMAYPIFIFLFLEGFIHTHNKTKYFLRLFIFAIISEIPFDLAFRKKLFYPQYNNVMWSFVLGFICILIENIHQKRKRFEKCFLKNIPEIIFMAICLFLAGYFNIDYGVWGVISIIAGYLVISSKEPSDMYPSFLGLNIPNGRLPDKNRLNLIACAVICMILFIKSSVEIYAFFILFPVYFYNGKLGRKNTVLKYFFYAFYPLHLLVLYGIYIYITKKAL